MIYETRFMLFGVSLIYNKIIIVLVFVIFF